MQLKDCLVWKTKNVPGSRKNLKMQNWRQEKLADALAVDHSTVSKGLKAMGMISKQGNLVSYELKSRDVEMWFLTYFYFCVFCIALSLVMRSKFITIIPSQKNHVDFLATHPYWPQAPSIFWIKYIIPIFHNKASNFLLDILRFYSCKSHTFYMINNNSLQNK